MRNWKNEKLKDYGIKTMTPCKTYRIKGLHFHMLRHIFTSNLLSDSAQLTDVQELLGHYNDELVKRIMEALENK